MRPCGARGRHRARPDEPAPEDGTRDWVARRPALMLSRARNGALRRPDTASSWNRATGPLGRTLRPCSGCRLTAGRTRRPRWCPTVPRRSRAGIARRLAHVDAGRSRLVVGHDDLAAWLPRAWGRPEGRPLHPEGRALPTDDGETWRRRGDDRTPRRVRAALTCRRSPLNRASGRPAAHRTRNRCATRGQMVASDPDVTPLARPRAAASGPRVAIARAITGPSSLASGLALRSPIRTPGPCRKAHGSSVAISRSRPGWFSWFADRCVTMTGTSGIDATRNCQSDSSLGEAHVARGRRCGPGQRWRDLPFRCLSRGRAPGIACDR